jgi:hypothetical protein
MLIFCVCVCVCLCVFHALSTHQNFTVMSPLFHSLSQLKGAPSCIERSADAKAKIHMVQKNAQKTTTTTTTTTSEKCSYEVFIHTHIISIYICLLYYICHMITAQGKGRQSLEACSPVHSSAHTRYGSKTSRKKQKKKKKKLRRK